ncbi:uncharacterized protein LOC135129962 [Zophobas morio]|uniref:uncharacterized protein LOC135129962 n=1 Tax=Zophobas morio TaxID=2755281 RepID=UPI003083DF1A
MRSKVNDIYAGVTSAEFDVICITETWLDPSINNCECFPANYNVFRADRDFQRTGRKRGGGVLLAVNNIFKVKSLDLSEFDKYCLIDIVGCKLSNQGDHVYIFVVYVPPAIPIEDFESFFETFGNFSLEYTNVVLIGDFNAVSFCSNAIDRKSNGLLQMSALLNLTQFNSVPNSDEHFLDLIFTSLGECAVAHDTCPLVAEDRYHPALNINIGLKHQSYVNFPISSESKIYNFKRANFSLLYIDMLNLNWNSLYQIREANDACGYFYEQLYSILDRHVPLVKSKKYKYPNWYSEELRGMLKLKRKLFRKYKRSHCDSWYHEFSSVRRTVKTLICRDFKDYINRVQSSLLSDPKFFWSFVKEKKGRTSIPNKVYLDDCCYDQPKDIVDAFAKLFCSSFNSTADDLAPLGMNYINKIKNLCFSIQITEDNVHQAINKLKNSSVSGVDQIPSFFIKDCSTTLLKPLCYLFNLCVKNASFPDIWKDARVTPVFKSGDFADVRNYRPVSILSWFYCWKINTNQPNVHVSGYC